MRNRERRAYVVVGLVFLVALTVLVLQRDVLQQTFVIPILYLFWLGRLVFNSMHQNIFWAFLLLAVAILLLSSARRPSRPGPAAQRRQKKQGASQRVAHWASQVRRIGASSYRDLAAFREFRKLIYSVWAYRDNVSPEEIERDVRDGVLEPPPEFQFYFQSSNWSEEPERNLVKRELQRIRSRFRMDGTHLSPGSSPQLSRLIQSLENDLEVKHD